ncbi:AAC(3) family N-acetyltransferase [Kribbella antibiotica]|uniref:Aminoglycoside N(3)-acetyltransferase n=1 Tax=Kribbella antibiotica TaxID=190195 RepID=A0A4R4ZL19_9ACTN|nr:AAC(3) family N-acetyltransferase [Kribbella antibiotica]TDD58776.1 AAC(3) family N-acetyltransferase [Kribbella antibiotica]
MVTQVEITDGLRQLGLDRSSDVLVHSSLKSFGYVEGGAEAVCQALVDTCGTVLMPGWTFDLTGVGVPPGLERPDNAWPPAEDWATFDAGMAEATAYRDDLPVDKWLGQIPDVLRTSFAPLRSSHPLMAWLAVGERAAEVLAGQRLDWPLGPIEALGGDVLLLGVGHTSNTTIHVAEQHLGRSLFYRYAKIGEGSWAELPNISGSSQHFDLLEPLLRPATTEVMIGDCRARRIPIAAILEVTRQLVLADPAAMLCTGDHDTRCAAAIQQRLKQL